MPSRCIDSSGNLATRRSAASSTSLGYDAKDNPERLAEAVRELSRRVSELEAVRPSDFVEFVWDVEISGATTLTKLFEHSYNCPIRWYIVYTNSSTLPFYSSETTQTALALSITGPVTSKTVIRVEPSGFTR